MTKKITIAVTLTVLAITLSLGIYGISLLYRHISYARFVYVENLDSVKSDFQKKGLNELARKFHSKDPLVLLEQVMNTVPKIETRPYYDALSVYHDAQNGKGTLCSGMASLYFSVLRLNGINARIVGLTRNLYDIYETHLTVEIFKNNKWVIFDPTFNVSFEKEGNLIGSQEIKESLCDGTFYKIKPIFYGAVKYPARLENNYIYWLALFNNVFVINTQNNSLWEKIPPFRYWLGPIYYYHTNYKGFQFHFHNQLIFLFMVIIPIVIYITTMILIVLIINFVWRKIIKFHKTKEVLS